MKRKYAIAVFVMLALLSACKNSSGPDDANVYNPGESSYTIAINMTGNVQGDSVSVSPDSGQAGKEITLSYTVANNKTNNQLVFSGTNPAIAQVDSAGSGTRKYTINAEDAADGVITINAVFTHSDPGGPASYAIAINMSGNVRDDSIDASPSSGQAGDEITLSYTVADNNLNNRLVFSGTATAIAPADSAGSDTRKYTINPEDAAKGVITINALFSHSDKQFDTIAFADSENETRTYGEAPFTKAITNTGAGERTITYSSSDTAVATVNNSGTVTILKVGTAVITATKTGDATYDEATAKYTLTVTHLQLTITTPTVTTTKPFDGYTTAAVTPGTLTNKVVGDTVTVSAEAEYDSADVGTNKTITVVYSISGVDAVNYLKPLDYTVSGIITNLDGAVKQDGAAISGSPASASRTSNSITIIAVTIISPNSNQIVEYAIAQTSSPIPVSGWQSGLTFSGLTPDTTYYVFARSKENDSYNAGAARVSGAIRTQPVAVQQPAVPSVVNFEADAAGKTYEFTSGGSSPTVKVIADPNRSGQKSLQITGTGYNQAAVIPINLPYALENYKSFSFKFSLVSGNTGTNLDNQSIMVYVAKNKTTFVQHGFGNPADSTYPKFADYLLGEAPAPRVNFDDTYKGKWTDYSITITNPNNTIKGLSGDIFVAIGINCGSAVEYLLDDLTFTPKDGFLPPIILPPPPAPTPPAVGAVSSGIYRNMFEEWGKTSAEVTARVNATYNKLFVSGAENEKIFVETGSDMAYIYTADTSDVRSEGMSYGMMMCVQMNDQARFDKLWKWAKTYMYNPTTNAGSNNRGYFAWKCKTDGSRQDQSPAPDGEFYFVTALLFASARWGNGTGDFEYGKWARRILYDMVHRKPNPVDPYNAPTMFDLTEKQPVFVPYGNSANHTDPSYHLPAFYDVWADELENDYDDGQLSGIWSSLSELKTDFEFYRAAATTSRAFFAKTTNPTTGLGPDYANFDGSPTGGEHADFRYDAWRIAMNIGMDYAWWAKDPWQKTFADRIQAFFAGKGVGSYGSLWKLDGTLLTNPTSAKDHSPGLVACNAVASLAATHENAWKFVEDFWNAGMTTGTYRYYDGCLYMLGMLHVSGNFKAYLSNTTPSASISPATAVFDKKEGAQADIQVTITPNGNTFMSVKNGAAILTSGTDYTVSGNTVTIKQAYLAAQANGTTTLTFTFSAGKTRNLAITVKDTTGGSSGGGGTLLIKYDSTNWPDTVSVTNSSQLSAAIDAGVLKLTKTGGYSTPKFILSFNLGSGNLSNYSGIKINMRVASGDGGSKDVKAWVGASYNTELGTNKVTLTAAFQDVTVPITHASASTYNGDDVKIAFAIDNTNPVVYEVTSIELIPKP